MYVWAVMQVSYPCIKYYRICTDNNITTVLQSVMNREQKDEVRMEKGKTVCPSLLCGGGINLEGGGGGYSDQDKKYP